MEPKPETEQDSPVGSKSLHRGFQILGYLQSQPDGATLTRMGEALEVNTETLRRYTEALVFMRKIFRDDNLHYHLDPEGPPVRPQRANIAAVQRILKAFVRRTKNDVALAVLTEPGTVLAHHYANTPDFQPEYRIPLDCAHATAMGHALLWQRRRAFLRRYFDRVGMPGFTEQTPITVEALERHLEPDQDGIWTTKGMFCPTGASIAVLAAPGEFTAERIVLTALVRLEEFMDREEVLRGHLKRTVGDLQNVIGPLLPPST